jgi:hypothetical protein
MSKKKDNHNQLCKKILEVLKVKAEREGKIKNPKLTHGGHEYGVDVVFDLEDGFGNLLKCGVQVISGDINASTCHTLLGQLTISFGHEFSRNPNKKLLDLVYVVTDGVFTQPADEYINSANVGFRNIICMERDKLSSILKEYLTKDEVVKATKKKGKSKLIDET